MSAEKKINKLLIINNTNRFQLSKFNTRQVTIFKTTFMITKCRKQITAHEYIAYKYVVKVTNIKKRN